MREVDQALDGLLGILEVFRPNATLVGWTAAIFGAATGSFGITRGAKLAIYTYVIASAAFNIGVRSGRSQK